MQDPHHHRQPSEGFLEDAKRGFNLLIALATIWSYPATAWTRRPGSCGARYFGNVFAVLGVLFWPAYCLLVAGEKADPRQPHAVPMALAAWAVTLIALLVHRLRHHQLASHGLKVHSLFSGCSWIPGNPRQAKGTWEPLVLFLVGALTLAVSVPLGSYGIGSAVALGLVVAYHRQREQDHLRRVQDAELEFRYYEQLRKEQET